MGTNKVFILDKYFSELQKFWDTEKRLQGNDLLFILPFSLDYILTKVDLDIFYQKKRKHIFLVA